MNYYRLAALASTLTFGFIAPAHAKDTPPLFSSNCAVCHGPDGKGDTPIAKKFGAKNLAATSLSEIEIASAISEGRQGKKMPAYKGKLSPEEIGRLAHFIKTGLKAGK